MPDLHDLYGAGLRRSATTSTRPRPTAASCTNARRVRAVDLWRKMLTALFETGHPWITFKDPSNVRSPQDHAGVVHNSNLCTEILLNTSARRDGRLQPRLGQPRRPTSRRWRHRRTSGCGETVSTAMRMLDNVIDINYYPIPEARNANLRHRPVGLGLMGFQDALWQLGIGYASEEAVDFADAAWKRSPTTRSWPRPQLAAERGAYPTYPGSKWDRGLLPIDTIDLLAEERGEAIEVDRGVDPGLGAGARGRSAQHGMRNSNTHGDRPDGDDLQHPGRQPVDRADLHQPLRQEQPLRRVHDRQRAAGARARRRAASGTRRCSTSSSTDDGSMQRIERIPDEIKERYPTAFEIEPSWLIDCAARRQKWIDMGQSLNLYMAEPSGQQAAATCTCSAWQQGPQDDLLPALPRRDADREIDARRQPLRHPAALDEAPQRLQRR